MATTVKPAVEAVVRAGPNFKVGQKKVYLPNHVVTLIENKLPPNFATFVVPLRFNKLDLRDYLYHLYGVEVRKVRSWLLQKPPHREFEETIDNPRATGRWSRPPPEKRMTVELLRPFVFPAPPEDRSPWDGLMHDRMKKEMQEHLDMRRGARQNKFPLPDEVPLRTERVTLAKEAKKLMLGEKRWSNGIELDERWADAEAGAQGRPGRQEKGETTAPKA